MAICPQKCMNERFWVCILGWLGLTLSYAMRFCLSLCIVEMTSQAATKVDPDACPETSSKSSENKTFEFEWSSKEQGHILSSFFWGYVVSQVPGGMVSDLLGAKIVLVVATFVSAVITACTPVVTRLHVYALVTIRVILGLIQGFAYNALHVVVARWVPTQERSLWGALVFSGSNIGMALAMPVSGALLGSFKGKWEYPFYTFACLSLVWCIVFHCTTSSEPRFHNYFKEKEKAILDAYAEESAKAEKVGKPPCKSIWLSLPVWAYCVGQSGHDWGFYVLVVDVPKYMASVQKFNVKANGYWLALGYVLLFVCALISGALSDLLINKNVISRKCARIIFTTFSLSGQAVFMVVATYMGCVPGASLGLLLFSMFFVGAYNSSLKLIPIDLTPNYAGFVGSIGNNCGALIGVAVPELIGFITPHNTKSEWQLVFWITFAYMVFTNAFFVIFASSSIQPWNNIEK